MFSFFKKNKKIIDPIDASSNAPQQYLVQSDLEKIALLASHFFSTPYLYRQIKDIHTSRALFVSQNYFNLHYLYGTVEDWQREQDVLIPDIKEALSFAWDIEDEASYDHVLASFKPQSLEHAWDIARISGITKDAYTVGYISQKKAQDVIKGLGQQVKVHYNSWESFARDFIEGKLGFNAFIQGQGQSSEVYAKIYHILQNIDILFNDLDSPFYQMPLKPQEDLKAASDRLMEPFYDLKQRALSYCQVYSDMPGWISSWLVGNAPANESEQALLDFVHEKLPILEHEDLLLIHAGSRKNPSKSDFDLILTTERLIVFPDDYFHKDKLFFDLKDLPAGPIHFKNKALYVGDRSAKYRLYFDAKGYEDTLAEVLNQLIDFIKAHKN